MAMAFSLSASASAALAFRGSILCRAQFPVLRTCTFTKCRTFSSSITRTRFLLCAREPTVTEPEIMPADPYSSGYGSYGTSQQPEGEVTEAEFTESSDRANYEMDGGDQAQYAMDGGDQAQYAMDGGDEAQNAMDGGDYEGGQYGEYNYDQSQYYDQSQQYQYSQPSAESEPKSTEPPPYYDNLGKPMKFIAMGRAMTLKLETQKDFERFLDQCSAYGVMIPERETDIKRNLCELDPKETWIVVDSRAVLKFAKKLALEEAERNPGDYPPGFVKNMLNRDKYGRYDSDDD